MYMTFCKQFTQVPFALVMIIFGQQSVQAQTPSANHDEIIVTATKRAENVQDVAISMAVFREQDIEMLRTAHLSGLSQFIPNMYLPPAGEAGKNDITIRGKRIFGGWRSIWRGK